MIMDNYEDKLWNLGLMEKTGEDEAEVYRRISSPQVPTAHCPAFIDTLFCNLVLGIACIWRKESRTLLSLDHALKAQSSENIVLDSFVK